MNKASVWVGILVVLTVVGVYMITQNQKTEPQQAEVEPAVKVPKASHIEAFKKENAAEVARLQQHPDFAGEGDPNTVVVAPKTIERNFDGFRVMVPDLTEASIEAGIYKEQLSYTLGNLRPELLDGMFEEYQHDYRTLINEMGLKESCDGPHCGLQISAGPFLEVLAQSGFAEGDVILALNSQDIANITDYETFKTLLFSQPDQIGLSISRQGEVQHIPVPVIRGDFTAKQE